eukprot:scaffold9667_cov49-Cylindrotheca_fusiformis.AAC.1
MSPGTCRTCLRSERTVLGDLERCMLPAYWFVCRSMQYLLADFEFRSFRISAKGREGKVRLYCFRSIFPPTSKYEFITRVEVHHKSLRGIQSHNQISFTKLQKFAMTEYPNNHIVSSISPAAAENQFDQANRRHSIQQ